jgi:hypothetical protein
MNSTHNQVSMAASLVGVGQFRLDATAAHPSKQLGHGQASFRARIDGRAVRGLVGIPATRDLPADLGWPGGCRAADHAQAPVGPSPSGHAPASPAQPPHPAPRERRTQQASTDPRDHSEPDRRGYGQAQRRLPCLGGGTIHAW